MTTVLIWLGSGFAFSVGVCVGAWCSRRANGAASAEMQRSLELLAERNEIGHLQADALQIIAERLTANAI